MPRALSVVPPGPKLALNGPLGAFFDGIIAQNVVTVYELMWIFVLCYVHIASVLIKTTVVVVVVRITDMYNFFFLCLLLK